jgi:hypothetical protein
MHANADAKRATTYKGDAMRRMILITAALLASCGADADPHEAVTCDSSWGAYYTPLPPSCELACEFPESDRSEPGEKSPCAVSQSLTCRRTFTFADKRGCCAATPMIPNTPVKFLLCEEQ